MAGGRRHRTDLGSLADASARGHAGQFPFHIRGFHSDNGSEFINHTVAQMLNKLLVEQTKSRPRHSNDNGLAEAKNGGGAEAHGLYAHRRAARRRSKPSMQNTSIHT
jgi:transposase InsO family protein